MNNNHMAERAHEPNLSTAKLDLPDLGPQSILWQRFGDWRSLFAAVYAGVLQVTQRDISTSLIQESTFFDNEVARLVRSAFPIIRTVYEGEEVGAMIRDFHRDVKGKHDDGTRYHSLNPEVFYWAHVTFALMPFALAGNFSPRLSKREKEQLFQESRTWYSFYGVAEPKNAPQNYPEFEKYFADYVENHLHQSQVFKRSRIVRTLDTDPPLSQIPMWLWRPISPYIAKLLLWVTIGLFPPALRKKLGWEWSKADKVKFFLLSRSVRGIFAVLPRRVRMVGIAERAFRREGA
ncbi:MULTISPECIES: oxygenase MpaB family protein [Corynebacterium]|uniref:oxygenase MpaB family protein n=1 Tax=Corynebacterium TaxID=1716 RepID=UPI001D169B25|nr:MULTISPECIES: oxygenase MpaB family protein [Corynebacterium]